MRKLTRSILAAGGLIGALALPACSAISTPATTARVTETGSTLLLPLLSSWQVAYHQQYPHTLVTTAGTGSGTGILDAATGLVSVGGSDSYLPSSVPATGLENIPLTVAALTVIYHLPGVHKPLNLDAKVLGQIYSGKITHWADPRILALNPNVRVPAYSITVIHRSDSSGSTNLFTSYLNAQAPGQWPLALVGSNPVWPEAPMWQRNVKGSSAVLAACQRTKGCLAYVGASYQAQVKADRLGTAALANGSKQYVLPTRAAMRTALSGFASKMPSTGSLSMIDGKAGYPVINYEYAIVQAKQPGTTQAAAVRSFLGWAITTGSKSGYLTGVGFVALPPKARKIAGKLIAEVHG